VVPRVGGCECSIAPGKPPPCSYILALHLIGEFRTPPCQSVAWALFVETGISKTKENLSNGLAHVLVLVQVASISFVVTCSGVGSNSNGSLFITRATNAQWRSK